MLSLSTRFVEDDPNIVGVEVQRREPQQRDTKSYANQHLRKSAGSVVSSEVQIVEDDDPTLDDNNMKWVGEDQNQYPQN